MQVRSGQPQPPLSHIITTHACCHHHSECESIKVYYLILMLIDSTLATTQVIQGRTLYWGSASVDY